MASKAKAESTIKYDQAKQALFYSGRDWYREDYIPVRQSDVASVYNQISRVAGDDLTSEQITSAVTDLFTASEDSKITSDFVNRSLSALSKAARRALALAKAESLSAGVKDYNEEFADDLAALASEHNEVKSRLAEIDQALAEHKQALSEQIDVTSLQIGWLPSDGGFYVDESTLKARSNVGTVARDYSARKWHKEFQSLKGVPGPISADLAVPDGKPTPDDQGKGSEFTCSLTPPSGKVYNGSGNSPTAAGKGAMVAMAKAEINTDVSSKAWGVPVAFGVPSKAKAASSEQSEDDTSE